MQLKILTERGHSPSTAAERALVRGAKVMHNREKAYQLSDGNIISVDSERSSCPEAFIQPSSVGKAVSGIHDLTSEKEVSGIQNTTFLAIMIKRCDVDNKQVHDEDPHGARPLPPPPRLSVRSCATPR